MKKETIKLLYDTASHLDRQGISSVIGVSHAEGHLLYTCTELMNWKGTLEEYKSLFNETRQEMKRHVTQDIGECSPADKGIFHGILTAENIINKAETIEEACQTLKDVEKVFAQGRLIYHKLKLQRPHATYHDLLKEILSTQDLGLEHIPLEASFPHSSHGQD